MLVRRKELKKQWRRKIVITIVTITILMLTAFLTISPPRSAVTLGKVVAKINHTRLLTIHAPMYGNPRSFQRGQLKENSVIVFIHVPKTGGGSIVENIKRSLPGMNYFVHTMGGEKAWLSGKAYIDNYTATAPSTRTGEKRHSVFLEIHTLSPSFMNMTHGLLQAWRSNAKDNGMELFVFTALREPMPWALSAFNWVHRQKVSELRMNPNATTTNAAVRDVAQENPQCSFLAHSWMYPQQHGRWLPKKEDCDLLFDEMKNHIDFVGTTEKHQDTIEMLKYLLDLTNDFTHEHSADVVNVASIRYNEMTNETIQFHNNISLLDYKLHENVQAEWGLSFN